MVCVVAPLHPMHEARVGKSGGSDPSRFFVQGVALSPIKGSPTLSRPGTACVDCCCVNWA